MHLGSCVRRQQPGQLHRSPSAASALAPLLKDNPLDPACITKTRGIAGEFISCEPMVLAGSFARKVRKERPLPIAVFAYSSTTRAYSISALQRENIKYRMSCGSPSLFGLISMVEAGLAKSAPRKMQHTGGILFSFSQNEGVPPLDELPGTINRAVTANGSARVMGGTALRARFQTMPEMSAMAVEMVSPISIRIRSERVLREAGSGE
jgi:hypothetical protein